jgi:hypothetical protein
MTLTDLTKKHVITSYVVPARARGEKTVQVRVGSVLKELGWTNRTPSVFSTLSSRMFQREAGVELIEKRGGPPSGGPSTTVNFVYRILGEGKQMAAARNQTRSGQGITGLYGICSEVFRKLGGGEAFLKAEREWGPDAWESRAAKREKAGRKGSEE